MKISVLRTILVLVPLISSYTSCIRNTYHENLVARENDAWIIYFEKGFDCTDITDMKISFNHCSTPAVERKCISTEANSGATLFSISCRRRDSDSYISIGGKRLENNICNCSQANSVMINLILDETPQSLHVDFSKGHFVSVSKVDGLLAISFQRHEKYSYY